MLQNKNSLKVLDIISRKENPRRFFAQDTVWRAYKDLAKEDLIVKRSGRWLITEKGVRIIELLRGN